MKEWLNTIRWWLIRKLAGRATVVINVDMFAGETTWYARHPGKGALSDHVRVREGLGTVPPYWRGLDMRGKGAS